MTRWCREGDHYDKIYQFNTKSRFSNGPGNEAVAPQGMFVLLLYMHVCHDQNVTWFKIKLTSHVHTIVGNFSTLTPYT